MKKGISIWSFRGKSLQESFALAKKADFDGVEVALAEDGEIRLDSSPNGLKQVKRQADDAGIELYSVASGLYWKYSLTSDDPAQRAKAESVAKTQLDTAAALGCETVLIVPGAVSVCFAPELGVVSYDKAYERSVEAMGRLAGYAAKVKVSIGVENVWNNFLLSPLEMRDFIDKIDSPWLGSYFDVGNVLYTGYPEQWIQILGKRIKKVHFKDYRRAAGCLDGFVDLLAGDTDYPAVISALKNTGYDGWLTAEMIPPYRHYSDTIVYNTSRAMDSIIGGSK
ncbi:MAG: sugar phosphate isomerase/epimerase [Firmicutes bacterium]|nr:sugar phosphate isomerase/epimerase [Bacillota bacterium]